MIKRISLSILKAAMIISAAYLTYSTVEIFNQVINKARHDESYKGPFQGISDENEPYGAIVRVENIDAGTFTEQRQSLCTAVVIDNNYALTAAHCALTRLGNLQTNLIIREQYFSYTVKANAYFADPMFDYAIISGDFSKFKKMNIDDTQIPYQRYFSSSVFPLAACGYAAGADLVCSPFIVQGNDNFQIGGAGFLYPGMSGGPVFDQETNTVYGVNSRVTAGRVVFSPVLNILYKAGLR